MKGIRELKTETIYSGRIFKLTSVRMRAPTGWEFEHQIIQHPGAAVVIPRLDRNHVVMVRQFRTSVRKVLWEFPAGTLESGESPLACAKREIVEEVGYSAKYWRKLAAFYPAPGMSTERIHLYLARGLRPAHVSLEHDEFLERKVLSNKDLEKLIFTGKVVDAKTILGFFFYDRYVRGRFSGRRG